MAGTKDLTRDLWLVQRFAKGLDLYVKRVSTLTYAPDYYEVYQNGRKIPNVCTFADEDGARAYINILLNGEEVCE